VVRVCRLERKYRVVRRRALFATAILAFRELNRVASCRLVISRSLGCAHVPGEGGGCGFGVAMLVLGVPWGMEVGVEMALTVRIFAWTSGWTMVEERVPDMVED
jgi:hypothetical protein